MELHEEAYQTIKDMNLFYQVNLSGELLSQEMMKQARSQQWQTRWEWLPAMSTIFLNEPAESTALREWKYSTDMMEMETGLKR